jgi:hypothetical protein
MRSAKLFGIGALATRALTGGGLDVAADAVRRPPAARRAATVRAARPRRSPGRI